VEVAVVHLAAVAEAHRMERVDILLELTAQMVVPEE
jgi:endonuclease/exonuclease/phosphatase family metal-dependent hydrolase